MNERSTKTEKTNEIALLSQSKNEGNENKKVKGKWKGDYGKKQQFRDGWKTHYMSNLHQFRDEKLVIQEVAQIQEEEEERRTRVTFNVIIIKKKGPFC